MSSDLRTLVEQEVELTHSELEDCFKQTHRILQTEYSRFAPGWVEYGHQVNKAVMSKVRAIIAAHEAKQATAAPAPAQEPVTLTESERVKCLVDSGCIGTVKMTYDSGPYEITRTSINSDRLIDSIIAALRAKGQS